MPLRGKKPVVEKGRPKVLFFGEAGAGKTYTSIHFPAPYYIDTEEGIKYEQYVDIINKQNGLQFKTKSIDEIYEEVRALLTEKHPYKTLIIDSISKIYNNLAIECAQDLARKEGNKNPDGTAFGGHLRKAQNKLKPLFLLIERLDMNVILIAHSKSKWSNNESIGNTFDFYDKLSYDLDLTLEIKLMGKSYRTATVVKSRIPGFEMLEFFDFSYDNFCQKYGKQFIEKDVKLEELASAEQITELERLIEIHNIDEKITGKWLVKAKASSFKEMETTKIQACIDLLDKKGQEMIAKKEPITETKKETKK